MTRTPAGSLGSSCPSSKFSIFQSHPRAWQGHGVPGPPQQRVKLVAVPRRARPERFLAALVCGGQRSSEARICPTRSPGDLRAPVPSRPTPRPTAVALGLRLQARGPRRAPLRHGDLPVQRHDGWENRFILEIPGQTVAARSFINNAALTTSGWAQMIPSPPRPSRP